MKPIYIVGAVIVVAIVALAGAWAAGLFQPVRDSNTIYYMEIAPKDQGAKIADGTVMGGVSWEPYCSDTILAGTGKALIWSEDFWPNHPCCVIAVDRDWLAASPNNEEILKGVLKAHIEATNWIQDAMADPDGENYSLLLDLGAQFSNRNTSVVKSSLEHMKLDYQLTDTSKEYLVNFTNEYIDQGLIANGTIQTRGYDSVEDFVDTYVDTTYLEEAEDFEEPSAMLGSVSMGYLTGDLHQFARVVASSDDVGGGESLFEKYGVTVTTPQAGGYANGGAVMDAFAANAIDIGYLGSPPTILKHLNGNINTVIVAQANSEGSAVIVNNDVTDFKDLGGNFVATPGVSSIQHLMLLALAEENGMNVVKA
jgi:NitT/TauT family transport system substrate-binding protein